jgi:hypothetical protein
MSSTRHQRYQEAKEAMADQWDRPTSEEGDVAERDYYAPFATYVDEDGKKTRGLAIPGIAKRVMDDAARYDEGMPPSQQSGSAVGAYSAFNMLGAGLPFPGKAVPKGALGANAARVERTADGGGAAGSPFISSKKAVTGSKDLGSNVPATVDGKTVSQWGPDDFSRYGEAFGVDLGRPTPLARAPTVGGYEASVPKSFLDGSTPSYWDQLQLKAQGINPNKLEPEAAGTIHDAMVRAVDPKSFGMAPNSVRDFNGFLFGLSSPNNPLTPNQIAMVQSMAKSSDDIGRIAAMTPWTLQEASGIKGGPGSMRLRLSNEMGNKLGISADPVGTGTVGSADWTRVSDFAKMMQQRPDFFRFSGVHNSPEEWEQFIGRVASQVPGLSFKTGSFGGVWQNPTVANISAMDRHMASKYRGVLFSNPKEQRAWEKDLLSSYNSEYGLRGGDKVTDIEEMMKMPGGRGMYGERALQVLGNHLEPKVMVKGRDGVSRENPRLPPHLRGVDWVAEPEKALTMSPAYSNALAANAESAQQGGRGIFSEQWRVWDPIRQRMEPHENMRPDLQNVGRMTLDQVKQAREAHAASGFMTSPAEVRKTENPASLALFGRSSPFAPDGEEDR